MCRLSQFLSYENRAGGSVLLHPFQFVPAPSPGIELLYLLFKAISELLIILLSNCFCGAVRVRLDAGRSPALFGGLFGFPGVAAYRRAKVTVPCIVIVNPFSDGA